MNAFVPRTVLAPGAPWPAYGCIPMSAGNYAAPEVVIRPPKPGVTSETLEYLEANPGAYATHIAETYGRNYCAVGDALRRLRASGRVRCAKGDTPNKTGFLMMQWWRCDQ